MAEDSKTKDTPSDDPSKGGAGIGLAILAVSAIAASFGVSYFMGPKALAPSEVCETASTGPKVITTPLAGDHTYVELQEILITIGSEPATRYLKMTLSVSTNKSGAGWVEEREPVLVDAFINYLRSVELDDFEDPAFYGQMREQLSRRSELVLGANVSDGILITEFLLR